MTAHQANKIQTQIDTLLSLGKGREAIATLEKILQDKPQDYLARLCLSKCLFEVKDIDKSVKAASDAEQYDPLKSEFATIQQYMQRKALKEAHSVASKMLSAIPGHPKAIFTIAHIANAMGEYVYALKVLEQGISVSPANVALLDISINNNELLGEYSAALLHAKTLFTVDRNFNTYWRLLSLAFRLGQYDELKNLFKHASELCTQDSTKISQVSLIKGQVHRVLGEQEDCIAAYHESVSHNPNNADAWWALADLKTYIFSQEQIATMKNLLNQQGKLSLQRSIFHFVLAKASEPIAPGQNIQDQSAPTTERTNVVEPQNGQLQTAKQWEESMLHYQKANQSFIEYAKMNNSHAVFNREQVKKEFANRKQVFSGSTLQTQALEKANQFVPIFIVGLPRSGSTLLEQMLSSHSHIESTIEQPTLPSIERYLQNYCQEQYGRSYFDCIGTLSANELFSFGEQYLQKSQMFRKQGAPYFIDKLPFNFRHIGLIYKILPQAKIIDIRRNPLDCGFSLYKQYFPSGVNFSFDQKDIVFFYKAYVDIMEHWNSVLDGSVHTIYYEQLVNSPRNELKQLMRYLGLESEEACLAFYKNKNSVHTASSEQVRQALNTKGLHSWKHAAPYLSQLSNAFSDEYIASFFQ